MLIEVGNNKEFLDANNTLFSCFIVLYTTTVVVNLKTLRSFINSMVATSLYKFLMDVSESDEEDKIINSYWRDVPDSGKKYYYRLY